MKKVCLLFFVCLLFQTICFGQQRTVTGKVIDAVDKSPLIGATVMVKGTGVGTTTDAQGKYTISAAEKGILVFSFVGMKTQEFPIGTRTVINVSMSAATDMDEVVVIGYGGVRRSDMTGAVASLKTKDVLRTQPLSINQALQGRLAGVQVNQNDGAPGGGISIVIRGANSFSSSAEPLYVVDGIPFDTGGAPRGGAGRSVNALSFINPQDIESLEVLKDASATAIYGSRGSNGVVLITTKKGFKGTDKIEVSANFSTSKLNTNVDFLDGHDYAQYRNEMQANHIKYNGVGWYVDPPFAGTWSRDEAAQWDYYNPSPIDFKRGYMNGGMNWLDIILQDATTQDYNLSYSGADDKGSYYISANFLDQTGVIYGSGYLRGNLRMNIERKINRWITAGTNLTATRAETEFANTDWQVANVLGTALYYPPTTPLFDPATNDYNNQLSHFSSNPYTFVTGTHDVVYTNQLFASAFVDLKFMPELTFRQRFGYSYTYNQREAYQDRGTWAGNNNKGVGEQGDNWYQGITSESLLTFDKRWGNRHWLNAVGAWTAEQSDWGSKYMWNCEFPSDLTLMWDMGAGISEKRAISSGRGRSTLLSLLARVNYSYNDKYLFTASFRRDGSSKFTELNKWGTFFSAAASWKMHEEEFMKDLKFISNFKWRLSYGETGNQSISPYQTKEVFNNALIVAGGKVQSGYSEYVGKGPLNENLFWETTSQYNAGLELGLFENRLNLTVDAYYKKTFDLLQSLTIPPSTGFTNYKTNYGDVTNRGLEVTLQAGVFRNKDFKWDVTANIYWNKNKIDNMVGDQFPPGVGFNLDGMYILRNGMPIGSLYGYVEDGFFDNEAEIRAYPMYADKPANFITAQLGEVKYKNLDGDPMSISNTDQTIIGDVNPKYQFGLTNDFSYKNWTCSIFFQGVVGNDILNLNLRQHVAMTNIGNIPQFAYDQRWTPENTANARYPKPYAGLDRSLLFSRRFVEDGSYVRLKNINLGYTFYSPTKFISSISIFANATNLFTISKYSWFDPDVNANGSDPARRGMDASSYPTSRTFSLGARLSF